MYANFQEKKSSLKRLGKSFHCSNVTTMKNLELFARRFREDIFLKIGIQRVKIHTKNVLNDEAYDFIPAPSRILSIEQVIVGLYK